MKTKIIKFLQKEYNAQAILLHGSRARGNPHKQSDWDLLVFTDQITKGNGGDKLNDQNLDIKVVQLPIPDMDKFISGYPQSLQFIEILLDTDDGIASKILKLSRQKYKKGPGTTTQQKEYIENHFDRMITRLIDFKDNPQIFFYHLSSFYIKTIRYWFEYQNRWSQPISEALEIIKKEDNEFMDAINIISDKNSSIDDKIKAAEKMISIILKKSS
ncbi:nucleotidyltransferase domain-containing protein [Patescibacteria group bacterium]